MLRTSLDGRSRKPSDKASKADELLKTQLARRTNSEALKEASPPKTNPWRRIRAPDPSDEEPPNGDSPNAEPPDEERPNGEPPGPLTTDTAESSPQAPDTCPVESTSCKPRPRSASASSSSSKESSGAAAPRAGQSLWKRPFGADILIHAGDDVLEVHRSVVAPKSGWLRDTLPPPNPNGDPIKVFFPGVAQGIGFCLKFMYTNRLEPCEQDREKPLDVAHVARCVLFYLIASDLRAETIAIHVLSRLERTSEDWKIHLNANFAGYVMNRQQGEAFTFHVTNALQAAYEHPRPEVVGPLRLALAGFLDVVLPLIVRRPTTVDLLSTMTWIRYSSAVAADMMEHRRRKASAQVATPSVETLQALFEGVWETTGCDPVSWVSRGAPEKSSES